MRGTWIRGCPGYGRPAPSHRGPRAVADRGPLSESWGVRPDGGGKVVWFTLPTLTLAPEESVRRAAAGRSSCARGALPREPAHSPVEPPLRAPLDTRCAGTGRRGRLKGSGHRSGPPRIVAVRGRPPGRGAHIALPLRPAPNRSSSTESRREYSSSSISPVAKRRASRSIGDGSAPPAGPGAVPPGPPNRCQGPRPRHAGAPQQRDHAEHDGRPEQREEQEPGAGAAEVHGCASSNMGQLLLGRCRAPGARRAHGPSTDAGAVPVEPAPPGAAGRRTADSTACTTREVHARRLPSGPSVDLCNYWYVQ
ncbi:hypothetical protein SRIMM317S_04132 [Streptomyces rimosus subsp. rimosus]